VHAGGAAADGDNDLLNVFGAGVGYGDLITEAGGIESLARQQLLVEAGKICHVGVRF
jgi:hypothetical protein